MTLAAIVLVSILSTALPWITWTYQSAPSAASANQTSNAAETQNQEAAPSAQAPNASQAPSAAPPAKTASEPNAHTTTKRHKKKVVASNCNSAPAAAGQGASGSTSPSAAPSDPATAANASAPGAASTPTNCPPSKVIVKQGGTSDPSIQLAGAAAGSKQTSQELDTAKQMLATTEANLKQIAGRQLTSSQQDMVTQIKQFMEQSKAAVADGDLDRARTLAWKAQVLSEELVKPSQ